MNFVIALVFSAMEIFFVMLYLKKLNIFSDDYIEEHSTSLYLVKLNIKTYFYVVMNIVSVVLLGCSLLLVNCVSNILNMVKLIVLMGILAAVAVVDLKKTIIPNFLIVIGLIVRIVIYVIELLFYNNIFVPQLLSDFLGFSIGFGILFIVSIVFRGAIGFGDVKLFGLIGLMSGAICTYSTLIFCLLISTIVSLILIITKKKNRKDSIPFGPFIFVGYVIAIILSCY